MSERAFAAHELAARAWYYLSEFPDERALAARRYREVMATGDFAGDHVLQAIGELAADGLHARAISAAVVRDRLRHIPNEEMALAVHALVSRLSASLRFGHRARVERAGKENPR